MSETTIGFRVKLVGNDDVVKQLELIPDSLQKTVNVLDQVAKKTKDFENLTRKLVDLRKEIDRLNKSSSSAGNTSSNSNNNAAQQKKLTDEAKETQRTLASVKKEIRELGEVGTKEYDDLIKEAAKLRKANFDLNKSIRDQQREFEELESAAGSYRQLNAELVKLRNTYRELPQTEREGIAGQDTLRRIGQLDKELKDIDKQMGIYVRNVGNYASVWNGVTDAVGRFGSLVGIVVSAEQIIEENAKISDSLADVSKTTNVAIDDLQKLQDQLASRNTRTSLDDQLSIGEIGGRAGILSPFQDADGNIEDTEAATAALFEFISAVDVANVALGDQFGSAENVADSLQGLRNVLGDIQTDNVGDDLLKIGNALNELETKGNATAASITQLVTRIAGGAAPLGVTSAQIFGISTTLDELEVTAERGGTAIVKIFQELTKSPETFAQIAGQSVEDFTNLVETNLPEALAVVAEATQNNTDSNVQFSQTLDELGLRGAGISEVFGKLGSDTDKLRTRIEQAGVALQRTDSLYDEFEKKNNNLAAAIDKLKNNVIELTVNSDLQGFLKEGIEGVSDFLAVIAAAPKFIKDNRVEIGLLVIAIAALNKNLILAQVNTLRKAAIDRAAFVATRAYTIAQNALNLALTANPIGLVVAAVALLTAGFIRLYKNSEVFREGVNDLTSAFLEFYENNILVRAALFGIVEPIRLIYGLFTQGPSFIKTYVDSLKQGFTTVSLQAQKLGLQLKKFLTIDGDTKAQIEQDIKDIEQQINDSRKRQEEIRNESVKKSEEISKQELDVVKKTEKEKEDAVKDSEEEKLNLRRASNKELEALAKSEQKTLADAAKEEIERRKEAAEAQKKIDEERLKAKQKIIDLENAAIQNQFDRQKAIATTQSNRDITGLTGSPEQIEKQTTLIKTALEKQINEIEKARTDAQQKAKEQILGFQRELESIQTSGDVSTAQGALKDVQSSFKIDTQQLEKDFTEAKLLLQQNLGGDIATRQEYQNQLRALQQQQKDQELALLNDKLITEQQIRQGIADARVADLQRQFEVEKEEIERQFEERRALIEQQREQDLISEEQRNEALRIIEETKKQQLIESEFELQSQSTTIAEEVALRNLDLQQQIADREVAINEEKNKQKIESEKKAQAQLQAINQAQLQLLGTFVGGVKRLLTQDQENRKRYAGIIKALALGEIAINLQKELSAIAAAAAANPANAITLGGAGLTQYGLQSAIAIARSGFAAAQVISQKLEFGGTASGSDIELAQTGSGVSLPPSGSGFALGPGHSDRGIKIKNRFGNLMEMEGGEYLLRNGSETYVINQRSSRKFKQELSRQSKNPSVFSASRKRIASAINSFSGYGVPLAQTGVTINTGSRALSTRALSVAPFQAPDLSFVSSNNPDSRMMMRLMEQNEMLTIMIESVDEKTDAINSRFDRLTIINNPLEALEIGEELKSVKNQQEL